MSEVVELGERRFMRLDTTTVRHDLWLMARAREAGLDQIKVKSRSQSDLEEALEEVIDRVIVGGHVLTLLSGLLLPDGMRPEEWTPEVAKEIEDYLSKMTDTRSKSQIKPLVASMLAGFFTSGLASLKISLTSSDAGKRRADEPEA